LQENPDMSDTEKLAIAAEILRMEKDAKKLDRDPDKNYEAAILRGQIFVSKETLKQARAAARSTAAR
jgi:predicted negative regulator of RcsB-dependent stress response